MYINKKTYRKPTTIDVINVCIQHIDLLRNHKNNKASVNLSKKHINFYLRNFKGSSLYRKRLMLTESIEGMMNDLKKIIIEIS